MSEAYEYKIILVGDGAVGKTSLVKRLSSGTFSEPYNPTHGVDVCSLQFESNHGDVYFNVWDTAGQDKLAGLRDGYYPYSKAAIIMFDASDRPTYKNVPLWQTDIERMCGDIPVVLCGNKVDVEDRAVPEGIALKRGLPYFDTSCKTSQDIVKPFEWLARKLTQKDDLELKVKLTKPSESKAASGGNPPG